MHCSGVFLEALRETIANIGQDCRNRGQKLDPTEWEQTRCKVRRCSRTLSLLQATLTYIPALRRGNRNTFTIRYGWKRGKCLLLILFPVQCAPCTGPPFISAPRMQCFVHGNRRVDTGYVRCSVPPTGCFTSMSPAVNFVYRWTEIWRPRGGDCNGCCDSVKSGADLPTVRKILHHPSSNNGPIALQSSLEFRYALL
jgi:hypothetical protein